MKRYRVLVCGTAYGQVYLSTFLKRNSCFQLAGILGKGSERTKRFAQEFGVPWYSSVNELPNGIDIACVAIRSTIAGGQGTMIAKELLKKGIHVIQEHPVHSGDIQNCLKVAKENCVYYQVNSHYVHVKPVTMFIDYMQALSKSIGLAYIEVTTAPQITYSMLDILGRALGRLSPCTYLATEPLAELVKGAPFQVIQGIVAGIPSYFHIQSYVDTSQFDNHYLAMHRVTIGTDSGALTLANTHGPLVWTDSFSIDESQLDETTFRKRKTAFLPYRQPVGVCMSGEVAPSLCDIAKKNWPDAVYCALQEMTNQIESGKMSRFQTQDYLCQLSDTWLDLTKVVGQPQDRRLFPAARPIPDPIDYCRTLQSEVNRW